ncbi:SAM-dependent methyltransferase [Rhodopila globiformis]|uniref:SAM-dependent methyltransferase n=1 Tax=Rhodopila globiformis TaxID=1071 RepID=A0A2S6N0I3_RHOGL|nr:SAM-dependent methyltransferase [Rhodopila globiformis]
MQADFHDAHNRHWHDAEKLYTDSRWANADHLYGLAVECGLKQLMCEFGMALRADGSPAIAADRTHADQIWSRYDAYRSGYHNGASYPLPDANPFNDWNASQRYANQLLFDAPRVEAHRRGALAVRTLIAQAQADGLLV